ncbi:Hypothetical predicted protein [Pelobates cultripes]|uniref:Uncharacterized protein n=1 Tax=Pelobates cultripes TaxID=61616 RepID=A0AAD1TL78_PELCU|nr:Hypothetical predicted protein [Pelobates cultripes]
MSAAFSLCRSSSGDIPGPPGSLPAVSDRDLQSLIAEIASHCDLIAVTACHGDQSYYVSAYCQPPGSPPAVSDRDLQSLIAEIASHCDLIAVTACHGDQSYYVSAYWLTHVTADRIPLQIAVGSMPGHPGTPPVANYRDLQEVITVTASHCDH